MTKSLSNMIRLQHVLYALTAPQIEFDHFIKKACISMCYVGHLSFCFATKTPSIGNLMMNNHGIKLTTAYTPKKQPRERAQEVGTQRLRGY